MSWVSAIPLTTISFKFVTLRLYFAIPLFNTCKDLFLCIHVTLLTVEILARQATFNFAFAWYLTFFFLLYSYFASCLKVMLCTVPCTVKYIQLKDYFVTWSIRFVCHYRLTTDKWKLTSCGFQVLTFLHGVGGGNVVTLHCVSPIPTQSVETDQKKNSPSSWSSVTWHQAELRGQVERTSVQGMTQVRSPSLSCCFIVAEAPPVGQPDLFTSSLQSDTFYYHLTTRLSSLFELPLIFSNLAIQKTEDIEHLKWLTKQ